MTTSTNQEQPWLFFALVYALSAPFWLMATQLRHCGLPDHLPITDVAAVFAPVTAAAWLCHRRDGWAGVRSLLTRAIDWRRVPGRRWLAIAVLLPIGLCVATYLAMRWLGLPVPLTWSASTNLPVVFAFFFVSAAAEELGDTAYATDALQRRSTALVAALMIGTLWALWHLPSMIQPRQAPPLIVWGLGATVGFRVLWTWLYNSAGRSVFVVILTHAVFNTARTFFPGGRSA